MSAKPKTKVEPKELITREAPNERALAFKEIVSPVISQVQFEVLSGKTPSHAIKTRPGRGGKTFRYVPHGFVTDRLNKAFGWDWDHRLLPVFDGNVCKLSETEEKGKHVRNVSVYGELTVRIHNPKNLEIVATIVKGGPGSQNWEETIEFGDALKGAKSDSLKVCASLLGIGLDLYYDDTAELQKFEDAQKVLRGNGFEPSFIDTPTTLMQFTHNLELAKIKIADACDALGIEMLGDIQDFAAAWGKLKPSESK